MLTAPVRAYRCLDYRDVQSWAVDVEHQKAEIFKQMLNWEQFSLQQKAKKATSLFSCLFLLAQIASQLW